MCSHEIRRHVGGGCGCHSPVVSTGGAAIAQPRVVVVSALARVTDQLMNAGGAAAAGSLDSAREMLQVLHQRHENVASGLVRDDERIRLFGEFD